MAVKVLQGQVMAAGLFSGAGASRFFDYALVARREKDDAAVKAVMDDLLILARPSDGGTYSRDEPARDRSYALNSTPLDDLKESGVPIFVAKSPIEAADLFVVEMLRANPNRSLRYVMLPGLDHDFVDAEGNEHSTAVLLAFVQWSIAAQRRSTIEVGLGDKP